MNMRRWRNQREHWRAGWHGAVPAATYDLLASPPATLTGTDVDMQERRAPYPILCGPAPPKTWGVPQNSREGRTAGQAGVIPLEDFTCISKATPSAQARMGRDGLF
jgi:hypothetical protein